MKLLITGGHLTPALAMIDWIKANQPSTELVFVGRLESRTGMQAQEAQEITNRQLPFISFQAPKFALVSAWYWPKKIWELMLATIRALHIILQEQPTAVLTFGGYLAVPIVLAAWCARIPIVTHEQTRTVGLANRFIGKLATKVGIAFAASLPFFNPNKTTIVGNPMRAAVLAKNLPPPQWFHNSTGKPLLVVTGGSQGSEAINHCIDAALPELLKHWCVVHQRGPKNYSTSQSVGYFSREWLTDVELSWLWHQPKVLSVSRAGANTVTELAVTGVPSVLIPLPFAYQDEQRVNAEWLVNLGGAILLLQQQLSPETLLEALFQLAAQAETARSALSHLTIETHAEPKLWQLITEAMAA